MIICHDPQYWYTEKKVTMQVPLIIDLQKTSSDWDITENDDEWLKFDCLPQDMSLDTSYFDLSRVSRVHKDQAEV